MPRGKDPDDVMLQRIIKLVGLGKNVTVAPGFAEYFGGQVRKIIRQARAAAAVKPYKRPKRADVLNLMNGFIDALAPVVEPKTEAATEAAAYVRLMLEPETDWTHCKARSPCYAVVPPKGHLLDLLFQRAKDARAVVAADRAVVAADRAVFAKPGPRAGSIERPELDHFLTHFVRLVRRHGGVVSAPFKSEHVDTGAAGSLVLIEVVHLVAPCFRKGFLPKNGYTLVDACRRAAATPSTKSKTSIRLKKRA
jgi:hypothetical protein